MKNKYREAATRVKIGVKQEEFVSFLKISKSTLAMHETGHRSLPTKALIKEGLIEVCLNRPGMEQTMAEAGLELQAPMLQLFRQKQEQCKKQLHRAKLQLAKMQQQYQQCINMLHVAKTFAATMHELHINTEQPASDLAWVKLYGELATHKLEACNMAQQQLLQIRMDTLQYEIDCLEQKLQAG